MSYVGRDEKPAVIVDIETVPNDGADRYVKSLKIDPDPKLNGVDDPPKTITELKNPELREPRLAEWKAVQAIKLEQSVLQKRQSAFDGAGLRWWLGKVVAIGTWDAITNQYHCYVGIDELDVLNRFFTDLMGKWASHFIVGKQSSDFDVPFLRGRCLANKIGLPPHLIPYGYVSDVNEIFSRSTQCQQRGKLEDYAWGMGIEGKDGSWKDVYPAYQAATLGDASALEKISKYCLRDVEITAEMWRRFKQPYFPPGMETRSSPQPTVALDELTIPF